MKFFKQKDFLVILILIINALIFAGLFYYDLNKDLYTRDEGDEIGIVTFKMNSIQRKPGQKVVWKDVYESFPLNNKDMIRTYEDSDATIKFKDGTEVKLDENSLIYFDFTDKKPSIKFDSGKIQVNSTNENVSITADDKKIDMGKGDFKLGKDNDNDLNFVVNAGNATVESGGKKATVKESQQAKIGSKGGMSVEDLPFALTAPEDQYKALTFKVATIQFKWRSKTNSTNTFLEVSRNKDFSDLAYQTKASDSATVTLPPATYFWRMKLQKDVGVYAFSDVRKLLVIQDSEIKLFSPEPQAIFPKTTKTVGFSWSNYPLSSNFKIQLSNSPDFSSIYKEVPLGSNSIQLQDLPANEYYWRVTVTPNLKDAVPVTSVANKFTILLTDEIPEEKPVFNKDLLEKSMLPNKEKINVSEKTPIKFHWQDVDGSNSYEFKVYNGTSPGRKEVFSAKTKKNEVVFSKYASLDEGKFYWEVNSVDVAGKRSEPARGSFELSTDDSLKKLNPEDIKIISSDTIYRTENE
jgi:hypothetical protein